MIRLRSTSWRTGALAALASAALVIAPTSASLAVTAAPDAASSGTAATPSLSEPPADALVAHYDFDADPLATGSVSDRSGHGLDATVVNPGTAIEVDGSSAGSKALSLPGGASGSNASYVTLPKGVLDGKPDLTVSTVVDWSGQQNSWQWLFALGTNNSKYLFLTPYNDAGRLRSAITTNGGGGEAQVTGSAALPANTWKTVTVTLDSTAQLLTVYLDGVAVGSQKTTVTAAQLLESTATSAGYLGKSFYGDPYFKGAIDDVRIYDAALTAAQVQSLYGGTVPTVTKVAQTSFELTTDVGTAPALPATTNGTYSDGYDRPVPILWQSVDPSQYAARGSFAVSGVAADGTAVTATVRVIVAGDLTVDLGESTGKFMGGASGSLYGVYGDGVPTANLLEGMGLRTVATKAQDGPQHPGADALEVVKPIADSSGGDVYIYMTDIYRGFPYEWPGDTPQAKLSDYMAKMATEVDQVLTLPKKYQDRIVFVPFNEPEGNMFGTGQWSYNGISWLNDPQYYFAAWDDAYALIKNKMPDARIAGPNTSVLYSQIKGFLAHTIAAGTVPDVMTWHELSNPGSIRSNVATYRAWEKAAFAGTTYAGKQLPINIDEYAFRYHLSVPGEMIQWISAIEDSKVDADMAYWNIDGNLSDTSVQANRGNGQWWLFNAYSQMSGDTVTVIPPRVNESYTLQAVATLDKKKQQARVLMGGASGSSHVQVTGVEKKVFGSSVHALVQEIGWSGQLGDSAQPKTIGELDLPVGDGAVALDFGSTLPALKTSSAYQIILTPGKKASTSTPITELWQATYEAEDAAHTGTGYSKNGPEGTTSNVSNFFTSGNYDVGGLRTGSDVKLNFSVDVPQDGTYDLSVFANSLNTYALVKDQGQTNVFLTVDGAAEQQLYLPLGYAWVAWDHADTRVKLTKGTHTITLAAQSLDGTKSTKGDAIVDKIDLSLPNPKAAGAVYEAENATLDGAVAAYNRNHVSGSGVANLKRGASATFWVYSKQDAASVINVDVLGGGRASVAVNGTTVDARLEKSSSERVFLSGGVNKVTVTGVSGQLALDRLRVTPSTNALKGTIYQAEDATTNGTAAVADYPLADGGKAVTGIGGEPGNANTLSFTTVKVPADGTYAMTVRYSNGAQSPASHYNPDTLAVHADISVNGKAATRTLFPPSFHDDTFWELTVPVTLKKGTNTIRFSSEELPNFDGTTYASQQWPGLTLRSADAPNVDSIRVTPFDGQVTDAGR